MKEDITEEELATFLEEWFEIVKTAGVITKDRNFYSRNVVAKTLRVGIKNWGNWKNKSKSHESHRMNPKSLENINAKSEDSHCETLEQLPSEPKPVSQSKLNANLAVQSQEYDKYLKRLPKKERLAIAAAAQTPLPF